MFDKINDQFNNVMNFLNEEISENIDLYKTYKYPIEYLHENVYTLDETVMSDLELCSNDNSNNGYETGTMYDKLCNPQNDFMKNVISKNNKYTTNTEFLKDTQTVIKNMKQFEDYDVCCNEIIDLWDETKQNSFFLEKYCYMDWKIFKQMNNSSLFLQLLSLINLSSPVISLMLPILLLILPYIIIKIKGIPVTFSTYITVLQQTAKHHFIGKLFNLRNMDFSSLLYFLVAAFFYGVQIYQNVNLCMRFYNNIHVINTHLYNMKIYIEKTLHTMEQFSHINNNLRTYDDYICDLNNHYYTLRNFHDKLNNVKAFKPSVFKIAELGYLLKMFFIIHNDKLLEKSLQYSSGFMGHMHTLKNIYLNIEQQNIHFATFTKNRTKIQNQYYPPYINEKHVKNDCDVNKIIITGPNASGKTTQLKTTALNIIFSQQYGVGFYESCMLNPYDYIHSYLNIPDTSGRDSLFQAESRRCREIIEIIELNKDKRHFTIFDELFSGTNPSEATKSAYGFLKYISDFDNVDFILTTHYTSICKKLQKEKKVKNFKMDVVQKDENKLTYTYKMKKGISKVQGALLILEDMNYPCEIIDSIKNYA